MDADSQSSPGASGAGDDVPTLGDLWIFGYGSLIWRPNVPFAERVTGFIEGWARRFWQGSTDHRGVPGSPGRVVTLVPDPTAVCWGVAYRIEKDDRRQVLRTLDHRERGGFERIEVSVQSAAFGESQRLALTYVAVPGNSNYLGSAPLAEIAAQVRRAHGPSGPNREYVLALADALSGLGIEDAHVAELAALVCQT